MHRPYGAPSRRRGTGPSVFVGVLVLLLAGPAAVVTIIDRASADPVRRTLAQARTASPVPLPGQTGDSQCTDPAGGTQWRVSWKASGQVTTPGTGPVREQAGRTGIIPTGFSSRPAMPGPTPGPAPADSAAATAGGSATAWTSRDNDVWNLRWTPTLSEAVSRHTADEYQRQGTLSQLSAVPLTASKSPRFVTPDGSCTVYATPFMAGGSSGRTVAVIGDSLVAQLYASLDGLGTSEGALLQRLEANGYRPEINGQAGRRWTQLPGTVPSITQANADMIDEIRGLREAQSVVIGLGVNDAGWIALSATKQTFELRVAWVLLHLGPVLDELRDKGHCSVLMTISDGDQTYLGSAPGAYQEAARRINAYLEQRADENPDDRLKLWDWAGMTLGHHTTDSSPWFGADTIHLNTTGQIAYAQELSNAAEQC